MTGIGIIQLQENSVGDEMPTLDELIAAGYTEEGSEPSPVAPEAGASNGIVSDFFAGMKGGLAGGVPTPFGVANTDRLRAFGQGLTLGAADEIEAGIGTSIQSAYENIASLFNDKPATPYGQIYDQQLEGIRSANEKYANDNFWENMALQGAGGALLPGGAAMKGASALGRIGNAARVGAGTGAISGFLSGEEGLANRASGALQGGIVGGALGGGIGALGEAGGGLINWWRSTPTKEAQEMLEKAGGAKVRGIPDTPQTPYDKFRSVAEITQDPELAALEQQMTKEGAGRKLLGDKMDARAKAHYKTLEGLADEPIKDLETSGGQMREALGLFKDDAAEEAKALYNTLPDKAEIPRKRLNRWIGDSARELQTKDLRKQVASLVDEIKEPGMPSGMKGGINGTAEFQWLRKFRQQAREKWTSLKKNGDFTAARQVEDLIQRIDMSIDDAAQKGLIGKGDAKRFNMAKAAWAEMNDVYKAGPVGNVLDEGLKAGTFQMPSEEIPKTLFDGRPSTTRAVLRASKGDPLTLNIYRGTARDRILRDALGNSAAGTATEGVVSPAAFRRALSKYEKGLTVEFDGHQMFSKDKIEDLHALARDLEYVDTGNAKNVGKLANRASVGQPTTAQALLQKGTVLSRIMGGRLHAVGEAISRAVNSNRKYLIEQILTEAMLDPKIAKALLAAPTPKNITNAAFKLLPLVGSASFGAGAILAETEKQ